MSSRFARLDLSSASAAERRVVQKVSDLLDHLQPARLDPAKQTVEVSDRETWVTLRHDSESETIDILADLLLADYTFDTYELWGKPWRDVLTISEPYRRTSSSGSLAALLLPLQRWATHVETRRTSFECRGARSEASSRNAPQ